MPDYTTYKKGPRCHECTLREQPGPVLGDGPRADAALIYIAQNPGAHEVGACPCRGSHKIFKPLVGPSGAVFNRQLAETGIRRDELYITNQVKCLTPANREPTAHEIACCRPIIEAELAQCRADTVVLAGEVAFRAWIGTGSTFRGYQPGLHVKRAAKPVSFMTRMGCVEQLHGRKWIGTLHPAFIMRMPEYQRSALDHLEKAYKIAGVKIPLPRVIERPEQEDIDRHIRTAQEAGSYADDVETVELGPNNWYMDICGYSGVRYEAIVLDRDQIPLMSELHGDPALTVFEQNGVYESHHIPQVCNVRNRKFDTMHALHHLRSYHAAGDSDDDTQQAKRSGLGLALKPFVVSLFTNLPYYGRDIESVLGRRFYCGLDNIATLLAGREQWRQLREWGLESVFFSMGMRMPYIFDEWREYGANVDVRRALLYRRFMEQRISKAELLIAKVAGLAFNPNSPKQVQELLYEKWGLPLQYNEKRAGGSVVKTVTTDNEARKRLRAWIARQVDQDRYKIARVFLDLQDFAEGEKTKLSFLDRVDVDGRIHTLFKSHGTTSFRASSVPNLQNWPVYDVSQWGGARRDVKSEGVDAPTGEQLQPMGSLRSIVIPDVPEEDVLLTTDFAQIEIWMYAKQSGCKKLLEIYERGEYIYGRFYELFGFGPFFQPGKPRTKKYRVPEVSEKFLRRVKAIPLGFLYLRSPEDIAHEHQLPVREVEGYRREFFREYHEIEAQYARDNYTMKQKGWIRYPWGHVIHFPNKKPTEVAAMRGQNPAAGMMMSSIVRINDEIKRRGYPTRELEISGRRREVPSVRMMITVHDSLTTNVPERLCQEVAEEIVFPTLSRKIPELENFRFPYSAEVGKRWDWECEDYQDWKSKYVQGKESIGAAGLQR